MSKDYELRIKELEAKVQSLEDSREKMLFFIVELTKRSAPEVWNASVELALNRGCGDPRCDMCNQSEES